MFFSYIETNHIIRNFDEGVADWYVIRLGYTTHSPKGPICFTNERVMPIAEDRFSAVQDLYWRSAYQPVVKASLELIVQSSDSENDTGGLSEAIKLATADAFGEAVTCVVGSYP